MNLDNTKEFIQNNLGRNVRISVFGIRNKVNHYDGTLYKLYPNIFSIMENGVEKSFSYRDIITKDISIKFI